MKNRVVLYFSLLKETFAEVKQKDRDSKFFTLGFWFFLLGFLIKAFQNISEIFRMPFQYILGIKIGLLRTFESYTNLGWILIVTGLFILLYLHFTKKIDLIQVLFNNSIKPHALNLNIANNNIVNLKNELQVEELIATNLDEIFKISFKMETCIPHFRK